VAKSIITTTAFLPIEISILAGKSSVYRRFRSLAVVQQQPKACLDNNNNHIFCVGCVAPFIALIQ
jgi:hypothetical protein